MNRGTLRRAERLLHWVAVGDDGDEPPPSRLGAQLTPDHLRGARQLLVSLAAELRATSAGAPGLGARSVIVGQDSCGPRGPARQEPGRPLIYNAHKVPAGVSVQSRSKRPIVGFAQRKLNVFLDDLNRRVSQLGQAEAFRRVCKMTGNPHSGLIPTLFRNAPKRLVEDCSFGWDTDKATQLFQACKGLKPDGRIGPVTWPVLEAVGGPAVVPATAEVEIGFFDAARPIRGLTVTLDQPNQGVAPMTRITPASGVIRLGAPDTKPGTVRILAIRDQTKEPTIFYDEFGKDALATGDSHVIDLPDKRRIVEEIVAAHGIERRAAWGARRPKVTLDQDWNYDTIVLHHSGDRGEKDPKVLQERQMRPPQNYDDIAYHYVIRPNGSISEGRYLTHKGASNSGQNTGKLGILIAGDFEPQTFDFSDDQPTTAQIDAAVALSNTLKAKFPVKRLIGHLDIPRLPGYSPTECPGKDLYKHLPEIRRRTGLAGPGP